MQRIRRKRKRVTDAALRRAFIFTVVFIVFVLVFGAAAVAMLLYGRGQGTDGEKSYVSAPARGASRNVLLIGSDPSDDARVAFVLMRLDFENDKISVTALPAGLSAEANGKTAALREQLKYAGVKQVRKSVENLLDIEIENTASVQLGSFESIIDKMGGLTYYVPRPLTFTNEDGGAGAALDAGLQRLTGAMAMQLMEYDGWPEGPAYRLRVQEALAVGLCNQYMKKDYLQRNALSLFKFASNATGSDFSMTDFIGMMPSFLELAQVQDPAAAVPAEGAFAGDGAFSATSESIARLSAEYS